MVTRIHTSATSPKYVVIAAALRDKIVTEALNPHTLLPSERELGEVHGVSRMTARQALSLLESEGLVYRRPPRGTFVAEPRTLFNVGSFTEEVVRVGRTPAAEVIWAERRTPDSAVREALPSETHEVHALQRLRLADAEPIALETTYFPVAKTPGLLDHRLDGSLWQLLREEYGVTAERARARIRSIVIDDTSCARLRIRSASAGILLTRWTYDTDGECFEFAQDIYRADRAEFEVSAALAGADRPATPE